MPAVSGTRRPTESIPGHVSGDWWGGLTHRAPARSPRRYGCSPHPCEHGVARLGWGFRPPITAPSLSPAPRTSGWCRAAVTADRHPALRATPRACAVKARPHRAYPVVGSRRGYRPPPHEPYRNPSCPSCACACASAAASRVGPRFPRACSVSRLRGRRAPSRRVRHVRYQAERVPTWCGPSGTRSNEERPWLLGGGVEVVGAAFEPLHPSAINPIPTTLTCAGRVQRKGRTGGEWPVYQTPSSSRASALRLLLRRVAVPPPHHASCDHTSTSLRSSLVPASPFQIHLRAREEAL